MIKKIELTFCIIALSAIMLYAWLSPVSTTGVNIQIGILCQEHPDKDCKAIDEYCRESLEKGHDCYIID